MSTSRIRPRLIALLGVLAGLLAVSSASPAFAHDELLGTEPADGAVVDALPDSLTLTFSGVLLTGDGATEIVVTDAAGTDLTAGDAVLDGVKVTQALDGTTSGAIRVAWRVVSSDGHPISGEYGFVVGDESAVPSPGESEPVDGDDAAGGEDAIGVVVVIGIVVVVVVAVVVVLLLTRRRPSRED